MIRITRQADYGIVLMTRLAADPERLYNAPELAENAGLPQPIVRKILKLLTREGLLASHRGVKGGYSLERAPESISIAEVIAALDGPIAITECITDAPGESDREPTCGVRTNWQRINHAILGALEQISLAEMIQPLPSPLVALGGTPAQDGLDAG